MKGILLAGGSGTRLHPLTLAISKHLLPIYDKPMVYYALSTLLSCGIRDILIISTPRDRPLFEHLLGDGQQLGCRFEYCIQKEPRGISDAFLLGESFIGDEPVALTLGDNIFYGAGLAQRLRRCTDLKTGSTLLAYHVDDPRPYGVITFGSDGKVVEITEKPQHPASKYIVPGLYFYGPGVVDVAKTLRPSARGELEITDIHMHYLRRNALHIERLERGTAWLDAGTFTQLTAANQFVQTVEGRQGLKIGCIEEIAFEMGYIDVPQLVKLSKKYQKSGYGDYLLALADSMRS